jgi:methyl-accepting chemotaxis protein
MQFLSNLKMGVKLIASYLILAAIAAVVGTVGIQKIRVIDAADTTLYEKMTIPLGEMGDLREKFQRQRVDIRDAIMTGDVEKGRKKLDEIDAEVSKVEESFQKTLLTDEGKALWKTYKDAAASYDEMTRRILSLVASGKAKDAEALLRGDGYKLYKGVQTSLDGIEASKLKAAKEASEGNTVIANGAVNAMLILIAIAVIAGLAIGIVLTKAITNPLSQGVEMMKEMAKGHLGMRLKMDRKDEIGDLARAMDGFTDNLQHIVGGLQEIAKGDLSRDWAAVDAQDEIAPALKQVRGNLQALVADAAMLSEAALVGRLDTRADAAKHQGDFRKIIQGVNETIESLVNLLDNMPAPAMIISKDFEILYMNKAGASLGNTTGEQLVRTKHRCYDFFRTGDCKTDKCACAVAMRNNAMNTAKQMPGRAA